MADHPGHARHRGRRPHRADPINDVSLVTVSALDVGFNTVTGTLIYRIRGAKQSPPDHVQDLLEVLDAQMRKLRDSMEELYGDFFIETTDDWEVPCIANLVLAQLAPVLPLGHGAYTVQNYSLGNGASEFGMGYRGLFTVKSIPEPSNQSRTKKEHGGLVGYRRKKSYKK